jgi:hypothetical protein
MASIAPPGKPLVVGESCGAFLHLRDLGMRVSGDDRPGRKGEIVGDINPARLEFEALRDFYELRQDLLELSKCSIDISLGSEKSPIVTEKDFGKRNFDPLDMGSLVVPADFHVPAYSPHPECGFRSRNGWRIEHAFLRFDGSSTESPVFVSIPERLHCAVIHLSTRARSSRTPRFGTDLTQVSNGLLPIFVLSEAVEWGKVTTLWRQSSGAPSDRIGNIAEIDVAY